MQGSRSPITTQLAVSSRFRIQRKLGSGSGGAVYLARDGIAERSVALKVIQNEGAGSRDLRMLQKEFRAIAGLRHPQIAEAYDFGYTEESRIPFFTREYVAGSPLGPGPPDAEGQARPGVYLNPLLDLLDAVDYLHAHGVLHLDIHAGNLIVSDDPARGAVLIDFGLRPPASSVGASRQAPGPSIVPPELLRGEAPGPAADLYSVGRLLLYRLSGDYEGEAKLPRDMPGWGARLTLELERIVGRAMHPIPEQRFPSAASFRRALARALGESAGAPRHSQPQELTIGRDEELHSIQVALERTARGQTACLWFHGPTGTGKSRLLTEARWRAQLQGLEVVQLRFLPGSGAGPALPAAVRATPQAASWMAALSTEHGGSSRERAARAADSYFVEKGPPLVLLLDSFDEADRESGLFARALLAECARRPATRARGRGMAIFVGARAAPSRHFPIDRSGVRTLRPLRRKDALKLLERLLHPLATPQAAVRRILRRARGNPRRLRQIVQFLHQEFGRSARVPGDVELPESCTPSTVDPRVLQQDGSERLILLRLLASLERAATTEEITVASGLSRRRVTRVLQQLVSSEALAVSRQGRFNVFYISDPVLREELSRQLKPADKRRIHRELVEYFQRLSAPSASQMESLSYHLLACSRQRQGRLSALETKRLLVEKGLVGNAIDLLHEAARRETSSRWRLHLAEQISELHGLVGDHLEGVESLEPVFEEHGSSLRDADAVRLCRRLGVHQHRAGRPRRAAALFQKALRVARVDRDLEDLVFIHSELAEIQTYQGNFEQAEEACRRGLRLLETASGPGDRFRGDMEVTLRATLAHLELRRMNPRGALAEFDAALKLTHRHGTLGLRATILNNLGIVHNQLDDYPRAREHFEKAERLIEAAGESSTRVQIACNLAVIAAKQGREDRAEEAMTRATHLLRDHPGERLQFFVEFSRGVVDHHRGRMGTATGHFRKAISLGRKFADSYLLQFGESYLAEALFACGRYGDALRSLRRVHSQSIKSGFAALARMAASRLVLLGHILSDDRLVARACRTLERVPRSPVALLEAWNDLVLALASLLVPESETSSKCEEELDRTCRIFDELGVPAGWRLSRIGSLHASLCDGDTQRIRQLLSQVETDLTPHEILFPLEHLVCAEACFLLGDLDRCGEHLHRAAGSSVGAYCLELDWCIELLRARLADRLGDREGARHHLHRCLQTRELLLRLLPESSRSSFLSHPRFARLERFRSRIEKPSPSLSTPRSRSRASFHGLVGASAPMEELVEAIEGLRQVDLPVVVVGETGTGKDLVARAVHGVGPRRGGPFYGLHCGSLPPQLFESELFGCEAGAFTGAEASRSGLLEHLHGGVLLLDGIASLSDPTQGKLLQVISSKTMRPLGSLRIRNVDVQFIATLSEDPRQAIERGTLREDLYYRLCGVQLNVPPLRVRRDDIPRLARHFLDLHGRQLERDPPLLSPEAVARLEEYSWPGNVRELESTMLRLALLSRGASRIEASQVRKVIAARADTSSVPDELLEGRSLKEIQDEVERAYLLRLFRGTRGDVGAMAEAMEIQRAYLYKRFRKLKIDVRKLREEL